MQAKRDVLTVHKLVHSHNNQRQRALWGLLRNYLFTPPMSHANASITTSRPRPALQASSEGLAFTEAELQGDCVLEATVDSERLVRVLPQQVSQDMHALASALHEGLALEPQGVRCLKLAHRTLSHRCCRLHAFTVARGMQCELGIVQHNCSGAHGMCLSLASQPSQVPASQQIPAVAARCSFLCHVRCPHPVSRFAATECSLGLLVWPTARPHACQRRRRNCAALLRGDTSQLHRGDGQRGA